jgi:serine/threonine protein kinase
MMVGRTLSHYKILEKLGSGGMGEVYVAEDTKLGRQVALKVLPTEMATGERLMRFEREAKAVAALDHPNIVTIYSVEGSEDVHFYTMQLVKGKTLAELISKKGLPLKTFFEIAIPLADAVSAAHERGIIHRDLKPDNLMVSGEGRLKILDFGLAKLKQELASATSASELSCFRSTPLLGRAGRFQAAALQPGGGGIQFLLVVSRWAMDRRVEREQGRETNGNHRVLLGAGDLSTAHGFRHVSHVVERQQPVALRS